MSHYKALLILLIPFILFAEERIFVTLENEAGKSINKIHYIIKGSKQGVIKEENLRISLLQLLIPGSNYFSVKGEFDKWLQYEDLTISFTYKKKDTKLESRLPLKKNWFKNGFTDKNIKLQKRNRLPSNVYIENEGKYPYRFKIIMGKKRYHIKGHVKDYIMDEPIDNVDIKLGDRYSGNNIVANKDNTGENGNFELILDIKIKPSSDPYILLRKAGYDINFQTINLDKLLDKDTLYMNVKLYPEIGSGCQYKQECVDKMDWNDECCQCTCKNPDVNMYYKEYEGKLIEICAKRTCEDNEIMQFKQYSDGSYYQECVPNPLQKKISILDKISGQATEDDILLAGSAMDCEKIYLLKQYLNSCSGDLPIEFKISNNSKCLWCDLLCNSDDQSDCDELYSNFGVLGTITEFLSMKIQQIKDDEFVNMIKNDDQQSFDYLNLLYQSMDYLGRIPESYKGVSDADMSRIYLSRGNYYLWFADKAYKNNEIFYDSYGEFITLLSDRNVGEFCNAYDELLKSDPIKTEIALKRFVEYGLDAYDQYDYYCASSGNSCQIINEQVTKLKRIRDEIKY